LRQSENQLHNGIKRLNEKQNGGAIQHIIRLDIDLMQSSSSSRMRVMNHNWSATKQRLHPQSVAEISRHSVLSGDRIRQCGTSSGSRHKDTDQCL